tara:strand:+ start:3969 stop:4355 length:387 start_codon:yes stop_codon:yes gene_type:complete
MASITSEQTSYLRFCDEAGNKERNGSGDYTDAVLPTNTILCLGGNAANAKMQMNFQKMNGTAGADTVTMDYLIATYGLPFALNELVKQIQKPGMTVIDIADVNTGFVFSDVINLGGNTPVVCTIAVAD